MADALTALLEIYQKQACGSVVPADENPLRAVGYRGEGNRVGDVNLGAGGDLQGNWFAAVLERDGQCPGLETKALRCHHDPPPTVDDIGRSSNSQYAPPGWDVLSVTTRKFANQSEGAVQVRTNRRLARTRGSA